MLYIKRLSSVTQNELQAVGYKASDLAQLAANLPVASSFVVLSTAFDETIRANGLKYKIDYMLTHVQQNIPSTLVNAYNGARKAMLEAKFPTGFETELREMYESITAPLAVGDLVAANDRPPVRIIVSMNRLDDPENNDTVIQNVNGFDELLIGTREAWALAYHPSQLGARMRERFPENRLKIALIVQVMDRTAAVVHAYSCLPQDHHKIYLQAYAGYPDLREKIAKDYYAIGKESLRVIAAQQGSQQELLERNERKELVALPMKDRFCLLDRDVLEIARLARKSERVLKLPVKAFFVIQDDVYELLWAHRLGFDIILKEENEAATPANAAAILATPAPAVETAPSLAAAQEQAYQEPQPQQPEIEVTVSVDNVPVAEVVVSQSEQNQSQQQSDFLLEQTAQPSVEVPPEAAAESSPPAPSPSSQSAVDVQTGVAAKLLNASLRIVREVVERKYRSTFGETNIVENMADAINRLNQANVFSRPVDGVLLLKAEEAAKAESRISEMDYAKTIEEVAFLMGYA